MVIKTYEGYKVCKLELNEGVFITLDTPRKPDEAKLSIRIDSIFEEFLGKKVKVTIEELDESKSTS